MGSEAFFQVIEEQMKQFESAPLVQKLLKDALTIQDYHTLLLRILPQVYESSGSFSLAAAQITDIGRFEVRSYLMAHAEEEKLHWQWIVNDLKATNYCGPDLNVRPIYPACAAYISYLYYTSLKDPIGRLSIAAFLESVGAKYGKPCALRLCKVLALRPDQATFFFGHGDSDVSHSIEIMKVLEGAGLNEQDWERMGATAAIAASLYRGMYS